MQTLPGLGIEPVSPASADGFLFPVPPSMSESFSLDVTSLFHPSRPAAAAAAAKSLQSCPTLCNPMDGSHQDSVSNL